MSSVNTKKVTGRRELRYSSYDELLADMQQLAATDVKTLGNWSYGQILRHLARSLDVMIDGSPFSVPAPMRWMMRLVFKKKFLTKSLPAGFRLPKSAQGLVPDPASVEEGLKEFKTALQRIRSDSTRAPHGGFGELTNEEWDQFAIRHAEMHMSFVVPVTASS